MKNNSSMGISVRGHYRLAPQPLKIKFGASGHVTAQVLDPDGRVAQTVEKRNLILNVGIEAIKTRSWPEVMEACVVGSGSAVTEASSTTTTASQSATTITLSDNDDYTFTAADVGRIIYWPGTQQRARIVSVTDGTHAEAYTLHSQTVVDAVFTIYSAEQTISDMTEIQRIGSAGYVTAGSGCGSSLASNVLTHKRTFDFPAEVGSVTYREVAFSHSDAPGAEIFSRIKLPSDLNLVAGQVLRVIYNLRVTLTPSTSQAKTADIVGWPVAPATTTDGDEAIQYVAMKRVNASTGATEELNTRGSSLEPSATGENCAIFLSTVSTALAAFDACVDRTGTSPAYKENTALDPEADYLYEGHAEKYVVFDTGDANRDDWRSMGIGAASGVLLPYVISGFVFVFDEGQTKDNLHTLELRFVWDWQQDFTV